MLRIPAPSACTAVNHKCVRPTRPHTRVQKDINSTGKLSMPTVGVRVAVVGWSIDRRCDRTALRLMRTLGVAPHRPSKQRWGDGLVRCICDRKTCSWLLMELNQGKAAHPQYLTLALEHNLKRTTYFRLSVGSSTEWPILTSNHWLTSQVIYCEGLWVPLNSFLF
jgi:hypothetical protein